MPYPNEHACRLNDPGKYDKFARKNCEIKSDGKCIDIIYGIKGDATEVQAMRYPKDTWSVDAARSHCKEHKGSFEAAGEASEDRPLEYRTFIADRLGVEHRADGEKSRIVGHAAVFDTIDGNSWFREKVARGAFLTTIGQDDIRALFNHDANFVLGRNKAGTLRLKEDEKGLLVEIDPPDTQIARDLMVSIERGDITQMSFAFEIVKESREIGEGKEPDLFTLEEVKLWDVSPVTYPFYKQTDVSVHARQAWSEAQRGFEAKGWRVSNFRRRLNLRTRRYGT